MRKIVFIALIIFCSVFAVTAQDINKNNASGKRHGLWKGIYEDTNRPRYEGTFENGRETGTFKFFENNKTSTLAATRTFAADGSCFTVFFDEKGNKLSEGREINKLREGEWKFYHPDGKALMSSEKYIKGKITGLRKVFFPNGTTNEETAFVNGIKEGPYKKYTEKGILLEDATYRNDQFHGEATYRDGQGNLVSKGRYTDGKKTGIWKFYENNKVVKEVNMSAKKPSARQKPKQG